MAKYRVWAQSISYVYLDVDAESKEEAKEIAENIDGGLYTPTADGDWIYGNIEILGNNK